MIGLQEAAIPHFTLVTGGGAGVAFQWNDLGVVQSPPTFLARVSVSFRVLSVSGQKGKECGSLISFSRRHSFLRTVHICGHWGKYSFLFSNCMREIVGIVHLEMSLNTGTLRIYF